MKVIVRGNDGLDLEYDTKDVTVLVMLTAHDADRIRSFPAGQGANYCVHPDASDTNETQEWMNQRVAQIVKKEAAKQKENPQPGGGSQVPPGLSPN